MMIKTNFRSNYGAKLKLWFDGLANNLTGPERIIYLPFFSLSEKL